MRKIGLLLGLLWFGLAGVHAQVNGVSAEMKLEQDQYLPGEDLKLKISIQNRSGRELTFGTDNRWLELLVLDEHGRPCEQTAAVPVEGEFSLVSGQAGTKALNLTPYFNFSRPGRYRVSATVHVPHWEQTISCRSPYFSVFSGSPVIGLANLQVGVPPKAGETNSVPEVRRYSLLKVSLIKEMRLYLRLTDDAGKVLRTRPVTRLTTFSQPEGQIDRSNNFHVLTQYGAHEFNYSVFNTDGDIVTRRTYSYAGSRPVLKAAENGDIIVAGGQRTVAADDLPPAPTASAQPQ